MPNKKLRTARDKKLWTMADAAEAIGVSVQTYGRWEKGATTPHISTLKLMCKAFEASPEELGFEHVVSQWVVETSPARLSGSLSLVTPATSAVDMLEIGVLALLMARQQHAWTMEDLRMQTERAFGEFDTMATQQSDQDGVSRRQALGFLASLPLAMMGATRIAGNSSLTAEDILPFYASSIPACWRLYFTGGRNEVERVLPGYITQMVSVVQRSPAHLKPASALASQAYQLEYLIALQRQDFGNALTQARLATQYANLSGDENLRLVSLVRQGNVFFALKRPLQCAQKYEEAIQGCNDPSPLLLGQAYIGLAEAQARLGLTQEARQSEEAAIALFPGHPESDSQYEYTHFNHFTLANFQGLMHLQLGQPQDAWHIFAQVDKATPQGLVPQRVELLSRQATVSLALGDLEQTHTYLRVATEAALELGSDLRYTENNETFLQVQAKWPQEKRVKELAELFR